MTQHLPEVAERREAQGIVEHAQNEKPPRWYLYKIPLILAASLCAALFPTFEGLPLAGRHTLFIVMFAAGLWLSEAMPAYSVALLVIGLEIALLGRPGGVYAVNPNDWEQFIAPMASPLIFLFLAGFILSAATSKTKLDQLMTRRLLAVVGDNPAKIMLAMMLATYALSMFMSNTATTAMMFVIVVPLLAGLPKNDRFHTGMALSIPFAANLGGMATIIGSPPNAIAAGLLSKDNPISFIDWAIIGLPPSLLATFGVWIALKTWYPCTLKALPTEGIRQVAHWDGPPWQRFVVSATIIVTIALWITGTWHGMPTTVVSFLPIVMLTTTGILTVKDIRSLPWEVLLLLGGGLSMGVAVANTGLADWMVTQLPTKDLTPALLAAILALITVTLSNLMSNTAAANVLLPIALAIGGADPYRIVIPVALAASAAMCFPISTPPNAIAYASGKLGFKDFLPIGIAAALIMPPMIMTGL